MKKFLIVIVLIFVIVVLGFFVLSAINGGLTTEKSYTFNVSTGDDIKISLNTSEGYDIDSSIPFTISKDDKDISQGTFITTYGYNDYINRISSDSTAKILDSSSRSDVEYTFYTVYNTSDNLNEYNYIIKVKGSSTGLLLGNIVSESSAQDVFEHLSFSKE